MYTDIYRRARYDETMLTRFLPIWTAIGAVLLLEGCLREGHDNAGSKSIECPKLNLRASKVALQTLPDWLAELDLEATPEREFVASLRGLAQSTKWTTKESRSLQQLTMGYTQRFTVKHFMDVGRRLAISAVSDLHEIPKSLRSRGLAINPPTARRLLGNIIGQTMPSQAELAHRDVMIRFVLSLQAWTTILNRKIQLSNWWYPMEYRWLLESTVLGYGSPTLDTQWSAHLKLKDQRGYPSDYNEAVFKLKRGEITDHRSLVALGQLIPPKCIARYRP